MFSANTSQVSADQVYVEDVFSTYLYTGNGSTQTITNGIDLAGKGGMIWLKNRTQAASHFLFDTSRGPFSLTTNNNLAAGDYTGYQSFTSSGFSIGATGSYNLNGDNYASWTFRKAPKFFDVVTYTGDGTAGRTVAHNLGVAPGCIIVKRTDTSANWQVYHRSLANTACLLLNTTDATFNGVSNWNSTTPTATEFTLGGNTTVNASGGTYVAYLFAHDTTSDGIIQCGSYSGVTEVNLGWEPQWLLVKPASSSSAGWYMFDNMRGIPTGGTGDNYLEAQSSAAENTTYPFNLIDLTSTGFKDVGLGYTNTIYIAIRRGPMRTPTSGTSVFSPVVRTGTGTAATVSTGNVPDWVIIKNRSGSDGNNYSRLTGRNRNLYTNLTLQEIDQGAGYGVTGFLNSSFTLGSDANGENPSGQSTVNYSFTRAPSFFDEVCYAGDNANPRAINHNLGVAPELVIVKVRNRSPAAGVTDWWVYCSYIPSTPYATNINLNTAAAAYAYGAVITGSTASTFSVTAYDGVNTGGYNYVAYLFASCPGVSKVGSYTGNGSSQTINCGFAAGARFVMIKRTDSTGDWYVWDSARGIVSGNDPHLSLNSAAAEVTTDDSVDTDSSGFVVNQLSATNINVSSATYIYLAVA